MDAAFPEIKCAIQYFKLFSRKEIPHVLKHWLLKYSDLFEKGRKTIKKWHRDDSGGLLLIEVSQVCLCYLHPINDQWKI